MSRKPNQWIAGKVRAYLWTGRFMSVHADKTWQANVRVFGVRLFWFGPRFKRPGECLNYLQTPRPKPQE